MLLWSGQVERGVTRDDVLHVLAARLSESEVYQWGMQCNKALRILFPLVLMKRKGKYKTYPSPSRVVVLTLLRVQRCASVVSG